MDDVDSEMNEKGRTFCNVGIDLCNVGVDIEISIYIYIKIYIKKLRKGGGTQMVRTFEMWVRTLRFF